MEVTEGQGSSNSESGTNTPAAADTTPATTGTPEGGEVDTGGAPVTAAPAYTPNFKYKVLKEEKEIPEWARAGITSAEVEKQARDIFERAGGIDSVKSHRDQLVQENAQIREAWAPAVQTVQTLSTHLENKDYDSFFRDCGISETDVLKYALHRIKLREQPEVLAAHDQMQQLRQQNQSYEAQLAQMQQYQQEMQYNQRANEFESVLQRPDVNGAMQSFDSRLGMPGAFRAEVINRGRMYAAAGQDISAERAAMEVMQMVGVPTAPPAGQAAGFTNDGEEDGNLQPPQQQRQQQFQTPARPATFPNLKGQGGSPVKKAFKSTDELREHAKSFRN